MVKDHPQALQDPASANCSEECPVRRAALIIEGKWTTQIVRDLLPGKKRFSELLSGLPGISPKVLSQRLQMLESHGLVTKTIYPEVPPRTEYELTRLGRELRVVIEGLAQFGVVLAKW